MCCVFAQLLVVTRCTPPPGRNLSENVLTGDVPSGYAAVATLGLGCNRFDCNVSLFELASTPRIFECVCPAGEEAVVATTGGGTEYLQCSSCADEYMSVSSYAGLSNSTCGASDPYSLYRPTYIHYDSTDSLLLSSGKGALRKGQCLPCFFPTHCTDGACADGTAGSNCERCQAETHFALGALCQPCHSTGVPWPAVAFGALLLLLLPIFYMEGLTPALALKLRILFNFLQVGMAARVSFP